MKYLNLTCFIMISLCLFGCGNGTEIKHQDQTKEQIQTTNFNPELVGSWKYKDSQLIFNEDGTVENIKENVINFIEEENGFTTIEKDENGDDKYYTYHYYGTVYQNSITFSKTSKYYGETLISESDDDSATIWTFEYFGNGLRVWFNDEPIYNEYLRQ